MLQGSNEAILSTTIKPPFSIKTFVLSILSHRLRNVLLYFKQVVKILYLILTIRYTNNVSSDVSCGFLLVYTSCELFLYLFLNEARLLLLNFFGAFRELYLKATLFSYLGICFEHFLSLFMIVKISMPLILCFKHLFGTYVSYL